MTVSRIAVLPRTIWQTLTTHPSHAVVAFAVLIVAVRMTLLAVDLNDRYHAGILAAEHSARSYAEVLSEHTARTFEAIDRTLSEVELIRRDDDAGRYTTAEAVHQALRRLQQTSPVLIAIGWTNADGDVEAHSSEEAMPASNVGDLPLFIAQRGKTADGLFVAPGFQSASSKGLITAVSRRLNRADGSFAGIAIAILDPSYFRGTYRSIELDNGGIAALIHVDGTIVAREPPGVDYSNGPLLKQYVTKNAAGSYQTTSYIDGTARIVGYKAVAGLPLVVLVSYDRAAVLGPFYERLRTFVPIAALLAAVFALGAVLLITQNRNLAEKTTLLELTFENMSQGLCMFDVRQRLVVCNKHYAEIYGLTPEQTKPGTPLSTILEARVSAGRCPRDARSYVEKCLDDASCSEPYYRVDELQDGRVIAVTHQPRNDGGWVAVHQDITAQMRIEAKIAHMARHDELTDVGNRAFFMEKIKEALARLRRTDEAFAVLMIDLDGFKGVNDSLGHPVGDELLKAVAKRLRASIGQTDTVARLGGDEFAILQTRVADHKDSAAMLATRILQAIGEPYNLDGPEVSIGVSIGVALAPENGFAAQQLLKNADLAMYRVKAAGRNGFRFFEPGMETESRSRHAFESDLHRALAQNELELHYQTIVASETQEVCAVEALVRWRHPQLGMILPDQFIPVAEESGLIAPLGEWILRRACADAAAWPSHLKIAVNLSPVQFGRGDLTEIVSSALAESGLSPERLELEVTESVLLKQNEDNLNTMRRLKRLGVSIVLDDFGTGYSSLTYLQMFPFDKIKIDRSFVHELASNAHSAAIGCAVVGLGRSLNIATVAEGVETLEQFALLRMAGCSQAQGYLFSQPVPKSELAFACPETLSRFGHAA